MGNKVDDIMLVGQAQLHAEQALESLHLLRGVFAVLGVEINLSEEIESLASKIKQAISSYHQEQ